MNRRIVLLVTTLPLVGISTSADAQLSGSQEQSSQRPAIVVCAKPNGKLFVREHCKAHEQQLDPVALGLAPQVIFRDVQRQAAVNPGEELIVAALCEIGEVVVSGGYITQPSDPLRVTLDAFFFDGRRSGWRVDFLNVDEMPATVFVRVNVACIQGTGRGE